VIDAPAAPPAAPDTVARRRPAARRWALRLAGATALAMVLAVLPLPVFSFSSTSFVDALRLETTPAGADTVPPGVSPAGRSTAGDPDVPRFSMIGLRLRRTPRAPIYLRTRDRGTWSDWHEVEVDTELGPDPGSTEAAHAAAVTTEPIWVDHGDGFQVSVGDEVAHPEVLLVRERDTRVEVADATEDAGAAPGDAPPVSRRAAWGARPPKGSPSIAGDVKLGVVHHSVTASSYAPGDVPGILRSIQAYHMDANGWNDIGYNFAVDQYGGTWEARGGGIDRPVVGAHAEGFNTRSVGVVVLGTFSSTVPTTAALRSVGNILGWKLFLHGADPLSGNVAFTSGGSARFPAGQQLSLPRIVGHRDVGRTECPGAQLYSRLNVIRLVAKANYDRLMAETLPFGNVESIRGGTGQVSVSGWSIDPDLGAAAYVDVVVDDITRTIRASGSRPDVGAVYPAYGPAHGFETTIPGVSAGTHQVCVRLLNPGPGPDGRLSCAAVAVGVPTTGPPVGAYQSVHAGPGVISVSGWALDPDSSSPLTVQVTAGGRTVTSTASRPVAGLNSTYGRGDAHGFDVEIAGPSGNPVTACVTARNVGAGSDVDLGCRSVALPSGSPYGSVDVAQGVPGAVVVRGWSIDPDTTQPVTVTVSIDGQTKSAVANGSRPDVGAAYPLYGSSHGYGIVATGIQAGGHAVCVIATNQGAGVTRSLGCRTVVVPGGSPFGSVDGYTASGSTVSIRGWAIDPDTIHPAGVTLWVDGRTKWVMADDWRPDVGAAFPVYGSSHGYAVSLAGVPRGRHIVCAIGHDQGLGNDVLLGCRALST
jgi:hypothetical protein